MMYYKGKHKLTYKASDISTALKLYYANSSSLNVLSYNRIKIKAYALYIINSKGIALNELNPPKMKAVLEAKGLYA